MGLYLFLFFIGGDSTHDVHRIDVRPSLDRWPRSRDLFARYQKGRGGSPSHVPGSLIYQQQILKKQTDVLALYM